MSARSDWPEYVIKLPHTPLDDNLHGAAMTLWFAMLATQPRLIRYGRRDLHRLLGFASYVLFPVCVLSMLLGVHHDLSLMNEATFSRSGQSKALSLAFAGMFATSYALAIWYRRQTALHARYMIATSFPLIGPVFTRLFQHYVPPLPDNPLLTAGATTGFLTILVLPDLVPAWLAWRDRHAAGPPRRAFRIVLAQQLAWQWLYLVLVQFPPHVSCIPCTGTAACPFHRAPLHACGCRVERAPITRSSPAPRCRPRRPGVRRR